MYKHKFIICFIVILSVQTMSLAQIFPPEWKKCIALIEQKSGDTYSPFGTSFLVIYNKITFLVTNRHIATNPNLYLTLNTKSKSKINFSIDSIVNYNKFPWGIAQNADVAILPLGFYPSVMKYTDSIDVLSLGFSLTKNWDYINEGDDVYIVGFPMGIGASKYNTPILRSGMVSLKKDPGEFLIDAMIFPGNSGSPVFLKPSIYDYRENSLGNGTAQGYMIGIISAYIPYTDVALSAQTKRPRVTFEENSGLAIVYSTDVITKLLNQYTADKKQ